MKNSIASAVSILALAMSISVIGPDHAMAKEKKQTGPSTKAARTSNARVSHVQFEDVHVGVKQTGASTKAARTSNATGRHRIADITDGTSNTLRNSSSGTRSSVRSTSNSHIAFKEAWAELRSNRDKTSGNSRLMSAFNQAETLSSNVQRSRVPRRSFNQTESLPSSIQ